MKVWFQTTLAGEDVKLEYILLVDDVEAAVILPHEIKALKDLKFQIEMMIEGRNELPWTGLVSQAKDLEDAFKNAVTALGLPVKESK